MHNKLIVSGARAEIVIVEISVAQIKVSTNFFIIMIVDIDPGIKKNELKTKKSS